MTLLASWAAVDSHGVSAVYIAADSRISWPDGSKFDHCRKVYGLQNSPDVFGYCGDVLFPSIVLGQICEMADAGLLFSREASPEEKSTAILAKLVEQFLQYPSEVSNIGRDFQILHLSKKNEGAADFQAYQFEWRRGSGWIKQEKRMPTQTETLYIGGSGRDLFSRTFQGYRNSAIAGSTDAVSQAVFQSICHTIGSGKEPTVGGPPQLVALFRGGPKSKASVKFGIIVNGQRFVFGAPISENMQEGNDIEWRNTLSERCDGRTLQRLTGAQAQPVRVVGHGAIPLPSI